MVVTRRSSRLRAFRAAAPALVRGVWLPAFVHSCSNALLGLSALGGIAVVTAALLSGARPSWWPEGGGAQASDARRTLAGAVDNGAWTLVTRVRPMAAEGVGGPAGALSEPWSVSLTSDAATAWLNETLPRWLETQEFPVRLPAGSEMGVAFEPGAVRLGLRLVDERGGERFVALSVTPRVDERGVWLPASSASLGRLGVPIGAVVTRDGGGGAGEGRLSRGLTAVLLGDAPALTKTVLRLPDGRTVRLLKIEPTDDRVVVTMRTEAGGNGQMTNGQRAK